MSDPSPIASDVAGRRLVTFAMTAVGVFVISISSCAVGGAMIGWVIGTAFPGYYRTVFPRAAAEQSFNPVDVGVGSGLGQGAVVGVVIATIIVLAMAIVSRRRGG